MKKHYTPDDLLYIHHQRTTQPYAVCAADPIFDCVLPHYVVALLDRAQRFDTLAAYANANPIPYRAAIVQPVQVELVADLPVEPSPVELEAPVAEPVVEPRRYSVSALVDGALVEFDILVKEGDNAEAVAAADPRLANAQDFDVTPA